MATRAYDAGAASPGAGAGRESAACTTASSSHASPQLESLPAEVLEQIGYFAASSVAKFDLLRNPGERPLTALPPPPPPAAAAAAASPLSLSRGHGENSSSTRDAHDERLPQAPTSPTSSPDAVFPSPASDDRHGALLLTAPSGLRNLLLTCRVIHSRLSLAANPRLYARVFRTRFDVDAISRRFGPTAMSSRKLAHELKRRYVVLRRIRDAAARGQVCSLHAEGNEEAKHAEILENLWLAFMMLVENDGMNVLQLQWAKIDKYVQLHQSLDILDSAIREGYPKVTTSRALSMQVSYLLTDPERLPLEDRDDAEEKLFVIRPFVFAAHKYDAFWAPWTSSRLPMAEESSLPSDTGTGRNPFVADLAPKVFGQKLTYFGRELTICPPNISLAACQSFFIKIERDPAVNGFHVIQDLNEESFEEESDGDDDSPGSEPADDNSKGARGAEPSPILSLSNPAMFRSEHHDKDFQRLLSCTSPYSAPGLGVLSLVGCFEGSWEGRFTFFDFDSYRDMLGGKIRALYEGPFGEQPQVWKIREHIVKVDNRENWEGGRGAALNAGYDDTDDEPHMHRALSQKEVDELRERARHQQAFASGLAADETESLQKELEGASDEAEGTCSTQESQRYEILLSGTGHSAWGRFVLRGRVRTWDGLVTMVKEYRPDGRGRWLYRGYVVAGNKLLGRWRDTFTPADMCGYEGCFQLYRRS